MRRAMVAGNWKMNGSLASTRELISALQSGLPTQDTVDVVVFPPYIYVPETAQLLANSTIAWGAQNLSEQESGAYTGEVAAAMLADVGCHYVLVGHSERRTLYGETDQLVAAKVQAALKAGLIPLLCVGETLEEREANRTQSVIDQQLQAVMDHISSSDLQKTIIAYEPIWAIGTGRTASPEQAQEVHHFIRSKIAQKDDTLGGLVPILYGGSVKASNAGELFQMPDIDGGLVGGASLKADEFIGIVQAAVNF